MTTAGTNDHGTSLKFTTPQQMTVGDLRKLVAHLDEQAVADHVPFEIVPRECPGHLAAPAAS